MANRHMKRCSMSLIMREMQIETPVRYHLTPVRTAIITESGNNKCWGGCGEEKALSIALWVRMQTGAVTVGSYVEIPQKIKNGSAF